MIDGAKALRAAIERVFGGRVPVQRCGNHKLRNLREGFEELFTLNRRGLTPALYRALGSANIIENPHSAARRKTNRVTRWRDGEMVSAGRRRPSSTPSKASAAAPAIAISGCSKRY